MSTSLTTGVRGELPLPESHVRSGPDTPRVLLAVADVNVTQVMKSSLDRNGFEVDTALTEDFGLRLFRDIGHDAVIIDHGERSAELAELMLEQAEGRPPFMLLVREAALSATPLPHGTEQIEKPLSLRYLVARLTGEFGYFPI